MILKLMFILVKIGTHKTILLGKDPLQVNNFNAISKYRFKILETDNTKYRKCPKYSDTPKICCNHPKS